ncbi:MAG TPA: FdtA/QdtA family cupin domain-containing protein [Polyangiaceae bacterium]|nr:FdtA/QdtA family cupin domain-containing protein [Polyangiaceae bacterium]
MSIKDLQVFPLKKFQAEGTLVFMEHQNPVPFAVNRVFCVTGVAPGATRGDHAHRECKQALVCVRGAIEVLCDDGREKRRVELTSSDKLLYVPPMIWASETYRTEDTVLVVLADLPYDNADYLRDYAEYLALRGISS